MTSEHGDRSDRLRAFFARYVAARGGAGPRIAEAFAAVPREGFAGPGPWSIKVPGRDGALEMPDDDPAYLYQDTPVAIDVGRGINFGEPSLPARCLQAVAPRAGEAVPHIGAGAGYHSALLADLVGPGGRVHAVEAADVRGPGWDGAWPARFVTPPGFIGCRGGEEDDATCWLRGEGWWLSTAGPGAP